MLCRSPIGGAVALYLAGLVPLVQACNDVLVETSLFKVQGFIDPEIPNVKKFLGIPYAEPPVGQLRFRPPQSKKPENYTLNATAYGDCCIQYNSGSTTVFTEYLLLDEIPAGFPTSEDCLSLNVWTPTTHNDELLPVMLWIHGGGLTSSCSNTPWKDGAYIVKNHQDMIVVSINYRLNLFGFPNAAALGDRNLNPGFLDQRKAIEWVYYNIEAFGGDPARITIFGQSSGSSAVGAYLYAWPDDPLISGYIQESGAIVLSTVKDPNHTNFTYLADQVNCTQGDEYEVFDCMQNVLAEDLIAVLNHYNSTANGGKSFSFNPQADNETSFGNYSERGLLGRVAPIPGLFGNNDNEFAALVSFPADPYTIGVNQTQVDYLDFIDMVCPLTEEVYTRQLGHNFTVPVYHYRYFGVWDNINPFSWLGSYHSAELPMVFGTYALPEPAGSPFPNHSTTPEEVAVSTYMQAAWVAFAKDPANGLKNFDNWPTWTPGNGTNGLVELGFNNQSGAVFSPSDSYAWACIGLGFSVGP
ncbi:Alpha/Beta hydrolase protein [Xylariales sp. PMI_506]|nr:Alpha/Beta hydrolase protein [Xylariales sp. PMI_506]